MGTNPINYLPFGLVISLMFVMPALAVSLYRDQKGMSRPQYFGWFVVCFIGVIITKGLSEINSMGIPAAVVGVLSVFFLLVFTVRRLTDAGWNPWLAYVAVVPLVSLVFFMVLFFVPQKNNSVGTSNANPSPATQDHESYPTTNNQPKTDTDKHSKYADPNRARGLTPQAANNQPKADANKQSSVSDEDVAMLNAKKHEHQSKGVISQKDQDLLLLEVSRKHSDANDILKGFEGVGSRAGIIELPLNGKRRKLLLEALGEDTRKTLIQEYSLLAKSRSADWSEDFQILYEYDSVVKDCHDRLYKLDPQLSDQFRQEVVQDRKQSKSVRDRLMAEHDKKMNPYDSGELNQAYSEAKKLDPSAGDEFVQIIDVMGEDVDIESILGKLKEKYS